LILSCKLQSKWVSSLLNLGHVDLALNYHELVESIVNQVFN